MEHTSEENPIKTKEELLEKFIKKLMILGIFHI